MTATISDTDKRILRRLLKERVYAANDGTTDTKGVSAPAVKRLRQAGLATVNGASRATIRGKSARRVVATREGVDYLSS